MRRVSSLLVLGLVSLVAGPLAADQVVLRDGRTLETKKPPVIKGRQAILTLADGKLVSIPAAEIDVEKTAAAAKKEAEAKASPPPSPTPVVAPSLVEAARATQNAKKASVVLTDQDVSRGGEEDAETAAEKGDAEVVVGAVTTKKEGSAYTIDGSVQNTGKEKALGVVVSIEAFAGEGKAVATAFGTLAKDDLDPGEKAAFRARIETDQNVTRFTYLPRWKAPARPASEEGAGTDAAKETAGEAEGSGTPAPTPPPAAAPEPAPAPRNPDYAAPPANAPVGAPAQPGGTYLPPPSSDQPKPPGGGA